MNRIKNIKLDDPPKVAFMEEEEESSSSDKIETVITPMKDHSKDINAVADSESHLKATSLKLKDMALKLSAERKRRIELENVIN